jgi:glycosidase
MIKSLSTITGFMAQSSNYRHLGHLLAAWIVIATLPSCQAPSPPPAQECQEAACLRIYQVMVEAFIDGDPDRGHGTGYGTSHHQGDLKGVTQALPYIKSLGMNAIWLTPIFASGESADRRLDATGYFARDYFSIDPRFGTLEDARQLVQRAHELGLYVFLDGVFGHHGGQVSPSPTGHLPAGPANPVDYPASLDFYREVATYWIEELGIDGWRLDQAYQVPVPVWTEIRRAVEETCRQRQTQGHRWGVLGYMVAEIWDGEQAIAAKAYGPADAPGLLSAFDFPMRYRLIQALAVEENGKSRGPARVLDEGFATHSAYPPHARPNLMLGNHDLVRFGDLIQRAGYSGPDSKEYWQRHRCAFAFMAAYSGPLTFYYGEESGQELEGFVDRVTQGCAELGLCDDHVSRTSGHINSFDRRQRHLQDDLRALLGLRRDHPALWAGQRHNLLANDYLYVDLKVLGTDRMILALNTSAQGDTARFAADAVGGKRLRDPIAGDVFDARQGKFHLPLDALEARLLTVE